MMAAMGGFEHRVSRLFRMDERTWNRHASPWSVWTRVASLPLLLAAVWSHAWLGWGAAVPILLVTAWLWLNPRLFPAPARTDTWSAKATFGERVWLNRAAVPIPAHHGRVAALLAAASGIGFILALLGAALNDLALTLGGGLASWFAKMWFCDRMVWLYEDMKDKHPAYAGWLRTPSGKAP
jgi:hypothetical protein